MDGRRPRRNRVSQVLRSKTIPHQHVFPTRTTFAELLSDMHTETLNSVNDNSLDS